MQQILRKPSSSPSTPQRHTLLKHLTLSSLPYSPITSTFFAERLYSLDTQREESVYLLALSLSKLDKHNQVIHLLRQSVACGAKGATGGRVLRPANEVTLRCARLYSGSCLEVGRSKEGRESLAKALLPGALYITSDVAPDLSSSTTTSITTTTQDEAWIYELELARLSKASREHERAVSGYRKVLEGNPWCWEAIEGLCNEGVPPDVELLFPVRVRDKVIIIHSPSSPSTTTTTTTGKQPLTTNNHPPPLGPSQTFTINSGFINNRPNGGGIRTGGSSVGDISSDSSLLSTPIILPGVGVGGGGGGGGVRSKVALFGGAAGGGVKRQMVGKGGMDYSLDVSLDESSFDQSFYPTAPLSFLPQASTSTSNSLFTPQAQQPPILKRARGQQPPLPAPTEDEPKITTRRPVRGVPITVSSNDKGKSSTSTRGSSVDSSSSVPQRRSSRLSRDPASSSMSLSRSATSSTIKQPPPNKKRTKNSEEPTSVPLSPQDLATQEAEDYVTVCLRGFGKAEVAQSRFESGKVVEAIRGLPGEQGKSWRAMLGLGRAWLELLEYGKAEKAFFQARVLSPHNLDSMELYSTLLWHLRLPTQLSFLAQDLMTLAPKAPASWIASGNVFSHLEDHAAALKCFKRAAQLDEACVYAYTLSGHECVVLEEWERALAFFREAVRLDARHYNAWFGLGNVYMQTGKYRLAEFHFRRAVEINPTNATLVCCIGSVLEKLGQRNEALELYEKACVLAPDSPAVQFKRVRMWIALKHYQQAEQELLRLKDRAPNEFNVYFLLGKLCKILDKKPEMLKYFGLAQDLEPRTASLIRDTIQRPVVEDGGEGDDSMEVDDAM